MFKHGKSSNSITEWILKDTYNSYYKSLHSGLHGLHFSSSVLFPDDSENNQQKTTWWRRGGSCEIISTCCKSTVLNGFNFICVFSFKGLLDKSFMVREDKDGAVWPQWQGYVWYSKRETFKTWWHHHHARKMSSMVVVPSCCGAVWLPVVLVHFT